MNQRTDIPEEICSDEIVRFLADRYHTTPRKVLERFLEQNNPLYEGNVSINGLLVFILPNLCISIHKFGWKRVYL